MRIANLFFRIFGILVIVMIALSILFRVALNTDYIRKFARDSAIESVPGLDIDRITGDLWHGFLLQSVVYTDSALTVSIDSVRVRYHVWGLLNGVGDIRQVTIYRPVVLAQSREIDTKSDTSAFSLPVDLHIRDITVLDGSLRWNDMDLLRGLRLDASARWVDQTPSVTLDRLETAVGGTGLDSTSVWLSGNSLGSVVTLEQLVVATGRSLIEGSGTTDLDQESVAAEFRFSPLSWRDIATLAGDIPLQEDLDMSLTVSGHYDALDLLLDVRSARYPRVSMGITITPDSLTAAGTVHTGRTPVTFTAASDWSSASPGVDMMVNAIRFDMRSINGFADFPTSINLTLFAHAANGEIDATLEVGPSTLNRVALSSASAIMRYAEGIATVREGTIRSGIVDGEFQLRQRLDNPTDLENRLEAAFTLLNLQPLAPLAGLDSLAASGRVVATLARSATGTLRFDAELDLRNVHIDTLYIAHANSRIEASIGDIPELSGNLNLNEIRLGERTLPFVGLRAEGRLHPDHIQTFIAVESQFNDRFSFVHEGDLTVRDGEFQHRGTRFDVRMMNERYRLVESFDVSYTESGLQLDGLHLTGSTGAELRLDAHQLGARTDATLSITDGNLQTVDTLAELGIGIQGQISIDVALMLMDGDEPDIRFSISSTNTVLHDVPIDSITVRGTLNNHRLDLVASAQQSNAPWLDMDVSLPFFLVNPETLDKAFFDEPVSGNVTLQPMRLESFGEWFDAMDLSPIPGSMVGSMVLGGSAGRPSFSGTLHLLGSTISSVPVDSIGLEWTFAAGDESIQLASTLVSLGQPALEIKGQIPFKIDMRRFTPMVDPDNNGFDLNLITRQFNLDALTVFMDPRTIKRLEGRMNGDLNLRGSFDTPRLDGRFEITEASAFLPELNIQMNDIEVELRFEPGRMIIQNVQARSNGLAQLRGTVDIDGLDITAVDVTLKGDVLRVSDTRNTSLFLTLNTHLKGAIDAPKLTGTVRLDRGHLFLEEFGENQVEQVVLREDEGLLDGIELYNNLEIEMIFKTERGFWVRNRSSPEMNLELSGEIDVLKSKGGDLSLFGTMSTNQGSVSQLGKRFVLEKGELIFSGEAQNPQLAIRSLYELRQPSDIKIWYVIGGTVNKPTFTFESDPEMDQQDIVSYTLFNRPFQQLMSWEQTMSGSSSIGNLAVDMLVDRVGELAANRLGLDVIEIDNTRTSGNSGTTIKAGKYLNDRLFLAIFQELGNTPDSQVILEYALRQHLNLIITGSNKRKSGIDIRWKYDY